jgi:hypothetical protein
MIPVLPRDPRTRAELQHWLKERERLLAIEDLPLNTPLTAREALMVEKLRSKRFEYSIT